MFGFLKKKKKEEFEAVMLAQEPEVKEEDYDLDEIMAEFSEEEVQEEAPAREPEEEALESFTEEELIAEFSENPPVQEEAAAEEAEETVEEAAEEVVEEAVEEASGEVAEEATDDTVRIDLPEDPALTADTVRIDLPQEAAVTNDDTVRIDLPLKDEVTADTIRLDFSDTVNADTVRIDLPEEVTSDTVKFTPTNEALEDTTPFTPIGSEKKAEPFSEGWEPEYEQPIGDYIPPQPIQFQPKSRLRELKKKLVSGPEHRYYEISEVGFIPLQFAILVCLLVTLLSAATTVLYAMGYMEGRVKLVAFLQLFCMLIATLMGYQQIIDGLSEMFTKRFSLNSILALSFAACIADGVFCLLEQRVPCCAAFSVQMTMSLWSVYHKRTTEYGQMDTLRKATWLDAIVEVPDYHEGTTGFLRSEGQVEDFMEHYREPSTMDKITTVYAICASCVGIALGVVAGVIHDSISFGLQVLAAALLVAVPGTFFISTSRPMAILEKRLHKLGTVLCGWPRINRLCKKAVFPLYHKDLFPLGSCKLNGVKFYGKREPEQVVAYAAAVVATDGGGLAPLFEQLRQSRDGARYSVQNFNAYGNGGIGGEVCGEPVLLGMHDFVKDMGVEIPEGTKVENAVYMAIDGELVAVIAVSCAKMKMASSGLSTLCGYRNMSPLLLTTDFMLTADFIRNKFGVNTRRVIFPEKAQRRALAAVKPQEDALALALTTREGLASYAFAVSGARSVRVAAIMGLVIHLIGGIVGLGAVAVLAVLAAKGLMTPVNMLLYQLIWMIPGLLMTEWTRSV